jgi:AsmA protein
MTKFLKTTGLFLSAIIVIVLVALVGVVTFISPNTFKPIITAQVLKYTGRKLTIDGDLSWTLFPYLGFKVGHMTLDNPSSFQDKVFAEVNNATVGVELLPMLHAKIQTDKIELSGVTLNLIKNADGTTNWQDLQTLKSTSANTASHTQTQVSGNKLSISIPTVDVSDSNIVWRDDQAHQVVTVSHFEFHAKNVNLVRAFPVNANFDFNSANAMSGQAKLKTNLKIDLNQQQYALENLNISLTTTQAGQKLSAETDASLLADMAQQSVTLKPFKTHITNFKGMKAPLDLTAEVVANLADHTVVLTNFSAQLANLSVMGKATLDQNSQVSGHLQTKPFDLKKFLQATGQDIPDLDFNASSAELAALSLQGKVSLDELQLAKLSGSKLIMHVTLKNSVLELQPITATFYQGSLQGSAKVDLTPKVPQMSLDAKLADVQIQPLLQDLGHQHDKIQIKGAGNINVQLTASGIDANAIVRNLNGKFDFSFKNGQLSGMNLGYLIDSAYALVRRQAPPANGENVTNFGVLSGTGVIQNGVITNKDLTLDSPRLVSKGEGTINLVAQTIDYNLKTTTKEVGSNHNDTDALNLYSLAIPVNITGSLDDPSIRVNAQAILQEVAEQQMHKVQNKIGSKISDQLKGKIPGNAGDLLQNLLGH